MEVTGVIFALLCFSINFVLPSSSIPHDQTPLDLPSHVLQLEQMITDLNSRSQVQEQKYALVLSNVLSKLTETTDELRVLKPDYASLQAELVAVKNRLAKSEQNLTNIFQLSESNSRTLVGIQVEDTAFEVVQLQHRVNFSKNEIIKFDSVKYKTPNVFGLESGNFTSPVSGTYMFWFNAFIAETRMTALVRIVTEHKQIGSAYGRTGHDDYHTCTGITVTHLQKGEQVWFSTSTSVQFMSLSHYGGALLSHRMH